MSMLTRRSISIALPVITILLSGFLVLAPGENASSHAPAVLQSPTPTPTATPDNYEPDNICSQANPITANGSTQTHNFHTASDVDWVEFDVSVGRLYVLETGDLGDDADTVLELYRSDCTTRITVDDDGGVGLASRIVWTAGFDGTVYAMVRPYNSSRTGARSQYDLFLLSQSPHPDSYEPDNTCFQARTINVDGPAQRHDFHTESDVDWVKFTTRAGTGYALETGNLGDYADTVLTLYDSDCTTQIVADEDSGPGQASRILWIASFDGTAYMKVEPDTPGEAGPGTDYDLSVRTETLTPDAYEPDDTCSQARSITVDGPVQRHDFHTTLDIDWVKFTANRDYRYTIETSNLGDVADTVLELYQADCTTRTDWDDDSGPGWGSRIVWDAYSEGVLHAKIRPLSGSHIGPDSNYDLAITSEALAPIATPISLSAVSFSDDDTSQELSLSNPGPTPIIFSITDVRTDMPGRAGTMELLDLPEPAAPKEQKAISTNYDGSSAVLSAYRYYGPQSVPRILVYTDDSRLAARNTYVEQALRALGLSYVGHYADCPGFGADLDSSSWDLVLISHNNWYCLGSYWNEIEGYLNSGGKAAIETFDIDGSHSDPTTLWDTLGIEYSSNITRTASVYRWTPSDRLFTVPRSVPDFTDISNQYADDGDRVNAVGTTVALGGFAVSRQANQAGILVALDGRAIVNSWIVSEDRADADGDGMLDAVELWINEIAYLTGITGADAPWLRVSPSSGTIPAESSTSVDVTYNARGLASGTYNASILITHDGTVLSPLIVPVTFTVRSDRGGVAYLPLVVRDHASSVCLDTYEPNDSRGQATSLAPGQTIYALICPASDRDIFALDVDVLDPIIVEMTGMAPGTNFDMWLYDPDGRALCGSTNLGNTNERIECTPTLAGQYYLMVFRPEAASTNTGPYTLRWYEVNPLGSLSRDRK